MVDAGTELKALVDEKPVVSAVAFAAEEILAEELAVEIPVAEALPVELVDVKDT